MRLLGAVAPKSREGMYIGAARTPTARALFWTNSRREMPEDLFSESVMRSCDARVGYRGTAAGHCLSG
jgi:hypothetical protein